MSRSDLIFRVDGGPKIGLGHLIRCLALARMIDSIFSIHFFCNEAPENFIKEIENLNYNFKKISNENDFIDRIKEGNVVVIDHYEIGIDLHKLIRAKGSWLVCIDDLHDKAFDADLIINHAPGVSSSHYKAMPYTRFALGPEYALLRPEFLNAALTRSQRNENRKLLICFGGSDFNNLTSSSIQLLKKNLFFEEIIVITGQAFSYRNQLRNLIVHDNRIKWYENQSARQMLVYMKECQFVLAPASSIAFEILSVGCTWLGGFYIENQKYIYEGFKKLNCLIDLGDLKNNLQLSISENSLIQFQNLNKKNPIDGKSDLRLIKCFEPYANSAIN